VISQVAESFQGADYTGEKQIDVDINNEQEIFKWKLGRDGFILLVW
jgi:hypothetical protein